MDRRAGGLKELDMTEKTVQMPLPHLLFLFNVEKKNLINLVSLKREDMRN